MMNQGAMNRAPTTVISYRGSESASHLRHLRTTRFSVLDQYCPVKNQTASTGYDVGDFHFAKLFL